MPACLFYPLFQPEHQDFQPHLMPFFCIDATRTSTLYKSFVNGSLAYLQSALQ